MKAQQFNFFCCGLLIVTFSSLLVGCGDSSPTSTTPSPTSSPVSSPSSQSAAATLSEIQKQPVWVKPPQETQELPGKAGMSLQVGETLRTEGDALAQVDLSNGLAFRIGGDATLTLQPNNQLSLNSGEMITWVQPGKTVPAEIVTPGGIAGIRGTTVYVKIPKNPKEETLFFSWEGKVAIRLPNQAEEILLESGHEVRVPQREKDLTKIRAAVRKLSHQEWKERRQQSRLLNQFEKSVPTLSKIEEVEKKMNMLPPDRDRTPPNPAHDRDHPRTK